MPDYGNNTATRQRCWLEIRADGAAAEFPKGFQRVHETTESAAMVAEELVRLGFNPGQIFIQTNGGRNRQQVFPNPVAIPA